jgi:hypothetical protein
MNVATGQVLTHGQKGHSQGRVGVVQRIDASDPKGLAVHVELDSLLAYQALEISKWLSHRDRRRWHLHFTSTSSSWLNLIERWFKEQTSGCAAGSSPKCPNSSGDHDLGFTGTEAPSHSSGTPPLTSSRVQRGSTSLNLQTNSTTEL